MLPPSEAERVPVRSRTGGRLARRLGRWIVIALALAVLVPSLVLIVYRVVPPPGTPLMLIRLAQGEGLDRRWRSLDAISPHLARAAIAAEDNRFCRHHGFDWQELSGELRGLLDGRRTRGASTITMQVAKNLFLWDGRSFVRKILEAWLTPLVELWWTKRRILEVYLNVAETGPGLYGAEAAAQTYFGKPAKDLTRREAARIIAILPNPRVYSATRPSPLVARRVRVIEQRIEQLGPLLDCAPSP
jgi:monofunctional biosynthetic peptidoglycan transglycosylase